MDCTVSLMKDWGQVTAVVPHLTKPGMPYFLHLSGTGGEEVSAFVPRGEAGTSEVTFRFPRSILEKYLLGEKGAMRVVQDGTEIPLTHEVLVLDQENDQIGHLAGVSAEGVLQGWASKPSVGDCEVPVTVMVGDMPVYGTTKGSWFSSPYRRFDIPLPRGVDYSQFVRISVLSSDTGSPFIRSPFYVCQVAGFWMIAAPFFRDGRNIAGAFQIPQLKAEPVWVELEQGTQITEMAECVHPASYEYNFYNTSCGFSLVLPSKFRLQQAVVNITHPQIATECTLDVAPLLTDL